jgi:hypothetical protein
MGGMLQKVSHTMHRFSFSMHPVWYLSFFDGNFTNTHMLTKVLLCVLTSAHFLIRRLTVPLGIS